MKRPWHWTKAETAEKLLEFVSDVEKYLNHEKILHSNREWDNDYLQRRGRELTWDVGREQTLKELGVDYRIIGEILVFLARGNEDKAREVFEKLKEAAQCLTVLS